MAIAPGWPAAARSASADKETPAASSRISRRQAGARVYKWAIPGIGHPHQEHEGRRQAPFTALTAP